MASGSRSESKRLFEQWVKEELEAAGEGVLDFWEGDHFDPSDPWSSVMSPFFDVAEILYIEGARVPDAWDFKPGMGVRSVQSLADGGSDIATMYLNQELSLKDLRTLGDFLNEASEEARRLSLDY